MNDVPVWLAALTSVGALVAAVFAGVAAWRVARIEQQRDRRAQAVAVSAWASQHTADGRGTVGIHLLNTSGAPVTDVVVSFVDADGSPYAPLRLRILPPGSYFVQQKRSSPYKWGFPEPAADSLVAIMKSGTWRVDSLGFVDQGHVGWLRGSSGALREAPAPMPDRAVPVN
ncbi:hypothetical protein [Subtercola boreus]|nr:hypothetical protein [Subtercola boreus]